MLQNRSRKMSTPELKAAANHAMIKNKIMHRTYRFDLFGKERVSPMKKQVFLLPLLLLLLCGCQQAPQESSTQVYAMDTMMDLTVYASTSEAGEQALHAAETEIYRLDALLSRHDESSAVSAINKSNGTPVAADEEVLSLLKTSVDYFQQTNGAFDVTVAPIMDAWNFTGETPRVPSRQELDQLLTLVGSDRIVFGDGTVTLEESMAVDLGGIAKGYASDRLAAVFEENGVDSAMVSLGGNVYARGTRPDGNPWRIAVQDPNDPSAYLGVLLLTDKYAITSGGYQRYFEQDGVVYYHIIDPKTGDVARSGLTSATVICTNGTMGDALSTALFVMGYDRAVEFWKTYETDFDMILVDEDGTVYLTEGLKDRFDPSAAEHDYEYVHLSKN